MDKLQEVKKFEITIFTSWLKKYAECGEGLEKAWHFLIEQAELAEKRQEIIKENKRQQEVAVHQFKQAQEEIRLLKQENARYEYLLGESELSDKIQSICDHCKLTSGGREITIKDEEFGFLIEEANKSHRLQEENKRYKNALKFYAEETTYTVEFEDCPPPIDMDWGDTAKKALVGDAE
ncbi:hypothetical protein ACQUF8_14190 [Bacillus subtilis]|uniref:hypothetical protein n=1 Tax=Bacillus TaxID=1386 RepID=UPI00077262BC|nr:MULTISPECIES: hypothetical protein [Bacillus subtilis group]KAF1341684.1 hypothetical protein ABP1_2379 [Bacillus subtilis]KXJ32624.1 hypothetical protein AX282_12125 [Bacillus spizizenii]